jgi:heat shock 70kDa protein 4
VLNVENGYYVEDQEVEEEVKEDDKKDEAEKKDADVSFDEFNSFEMAPPNAAASSSAPVGDDAMRLFKRHEREDDALRSSKRPRSDLPFGRKPSLRPNRPTVASEDNDILTTISSKAMDTDAKDDAPKKTRKVKKQVRKGDLPIASGTASLDDASKSALAEKESAMVMEDKLVADTEEKKNELEAYIYDLRAKLDEQYAEFSSEEEKASIKAKLEATEVRLFIINPPFVPTK